MEAVMSGEPDYTRRWLVNAGGAAILANVGPITASSAQTAAAAPRGSPPELSAVPATRPVSPVTTALADYVAKALDRELPPAVDAAHRDLAADADGLFVEICDQARDRVNEMRLDGLDRRRVDVGMTQPVGVGGEPFPKRAGSRLRPHGFRCRSAACQAAKTESGGAEDDATAGNLV
jgi:hypothetical protein